MATILDEQRRRSSFGDAAAVAQNPGTTQVGPAPAAPPVAPPPTSPIAAPAAVTPLPITANSVPAAASPSSFGAPATPAPVAPAQSGFGLGPGTARPASFGDAAAASSQPGTQVVKSGPISTAAAVAPPVPAAAPAPSQGFGIGQPAPTITGQASALSALGNPFNTAATPPPSAPAPAPAPSAFGLPSTATAAATQPSSLSSFGGPDTGAAGATAASPTAAPASAYAAPSFQPAGSVSVIGDAGVTSADRIGQMQRDAAHVREMGIAQGLRPQADVLTTQPGFGFIPDAGPFRARNEDAFQLGKAQYDLQQATNTLVRGRPNQAAIQSATQRLADLQTSQTQGERNAADVQRAQITEQGLDSRARVVDARQQQELGINQQRLNLEARRDDRAATGSLIEQTQKARLATLQDQVLNGNPQQREEAAAAIAAMQGREYGSKPTEGYRRTANGNWEPIPGGPAFKEGLQQAKDTQDIFGIIDQARPLLGQATNSYIGVGADKAAQAFGVSTSGATAGAQLKALQGALIAKMPKMSGPQSDKDVQLYREMAGQIGDPTIPAEQRNAALDTVRQLNEKYLPVASSPADAQNLPSGAYFRTPDGKTRRKP